MSATSDSTDPVQTVIDLLQGTQTEYGQLYGVSYGDSGEWPSGPKPDPIEGQWDSDFRTKSNRQHPAAYVHSPAVGLRDPAGRRFSATMQDETVRVAVWSPDPDEADALAGDVVDILGNYANDGGCNTVWRQIRPQEIDDRRAEMLARRADHAVVAVDVLLRREDRTGTT